MLWLRALTLLILLGNPVLLQGTRNTRDLGGLPVAGGQVRAHMIYRSGALCYITPQDVRTVQELGLATIVDLRKPTEIEKEGPDRVRVRSLILAPMSNSQGLGQEAYHYYIRENAAAVRSFFAALAQPESYPLLFHCSAGKDRTGILAALLLELLGASRDVVESDYLQSIKNSPRLVVKPEWLGEIFAAVDAAGGIEPFLRANGVSDEELQQVRAQLIVPTTP